MNRYISILLISLFTLSVYAYEPEYSYSVISTRHYGAQSDADNDRYSQNDYYNSYRVRTQTNSDSYHSSYGSDRVDRISANTFSSTPSMEITTMLPTIDEKHNGYGGPRRSSGVRPPQRGIDGSDMTDPDVKDPETNDPNATPLGDTPWLLMLLLALGYALRVGKKRGLRIPGTGK